MTLPVLGFPPDQTSYAATPGPSGVSTQLDGGASRFRADKLGAAILLPVQWTCTPKAYNYLWAFYRTSINYGADPFSIDLIIDSNVPQTYVAHFMPGTFGLASTQGLTYVVGATLEVFPNAAYASGDAALIAGGPQ